MTFDELSQPWKETNKKSLNSEQLQQSILNICRKTAKHHHIIFRRDLMEMVACLFTFFFFGRSLFRAESLLTQIGSIVILIGTVNVLYQLNRRRLHEKSLPLDCAVRDYIHREKEENEFQIGLLTSMVWWYLAPIWVGANIFYAGHDKIPIPIWGYLIFSSLLCWGIYHLNQSAIKKQFLPIQVELEKLLQDLEDVDSC